MTTVDSAWEELEHELPVVGDPAPQARRQGMLLLAGFALVVLIAAATAIAVVRNQEFVAAVAEARTQQLRLFDLLVVIQKAETGQRGYLLTGDVRYLQPFETARDGLPDRLAELAAGADGMPGQAADVGLLEQRAAAKIEELAQTVALFDAGRLDEALAIVRSDRGLVLMQQLEDTLARLQASVTALVDERRSALRRNGHLQLGLVLLGLSLILVLGIVVVRRFHQQYRALVAASERLGRFNQELERAVASRTAELAEANEEIQRFAYIVSHDLRAPLVNIMGFATELDHGFNDIETKLPADDENARMALAELREAQGFIQSATEKMDRLIAAILSLSRAGRRVFTPEPIELGQLLGSIADTLRHKTAEAGASITVRSLPTVTSDRLALEQIFGNLLDNALKYLEAGRPGEITVEASERRSAVEIRVADNGRGIEPKDHARIFDLFRRAGSQDRPGEGIGLAHVRMLVRRLGGSIRVSSIPHKGSTFSVRLPRAWRPQEEERQR